MDSRWHKSQPAWQIDYPAPINKIVDVVPPNVIKPKKDLKMKVRVLGGSLQEAKSNNGHGNNADGVDSSNPGNGNGGPNGTIDLSNGIDDELNDDELKVGSITCQSKSSGASVVQLGLASSMAPSRR